MLARVRVGASRPARSGRAAPGPARQRRRGGVARGRRLRRRHAAGADPVRAGRGARAVGLALSRRAGWRGAGAAGRPAEGEWSDLYAFVPKPVPFVDLETSNWFTCSHPRLAVRDRPADQRPERGRHAHHAERLGRAVAGEQTPRERTVTPVTREQIPALLAERFGLAGFALDAAGRVVRAAGEGSGMASKPPAHVAIANLIAG